MVGRRHRRRALGPRRAGHEVPDRRRGRAPPRRSRASGWRGKGDLLVVVVVDEETGGAEGAQWICSEHPDKVRADYLLNEGAGSLVPVRRPEGVRRLRRGEGRLSLQAAHARRRGPRVDARRSATTRCSSSRRCCRRWRTASPTFDVTDGPQAMLDGLGVSVRGAARQGPAAGADRRADARRDAGAHARAGQREDQRDPVAGRDRRRLPRPAGARARRTLRARSTRCSATTGYEIEFSETVIGNQSPVESPLMDVIGGWVARRSPSARVVPAILPGFTDSRTFRARSPTGRLRVLPAARR